MGARGNLATSIESRVFRHPSGKRWRVSHLWLVCWRNLTNLPRQTVFVPTCSSRVERPLQISGPFVGANRIRPESGALNYGRFAPGADLSDLPWRLSSPAGRRIAGGHNFAWIECAGPEWTRGHTGPAKHFHGFPCLAKNVSRFYILETPFGRPFRSVTSGWPKKILSGQGGMILQLRASVSR